MVQCDGCEVWIHTQCDGISDEDYAAIGDAAQVGRRGAESARARPFWKTHTGTLHCWPGLSQQYFCPTCREGRNIDPIDIMDGAQGVWAGPPVIAAEDALADFSRLTYTHRCRGSQGRGGRRRPGLQRPALERAALRHQGPCPSPGQARPLQPALNPVYVSWEGHTRRLAQVQLVTRTKQLAPASIVRKDDAGELGLERRVLVHQIGTTQRFDGARVVNGRDEGFQRLYSCYLAGACPSPPYLLFTSLAKRSISRTLEWLSVADCRQRLFSADATGIGTCSQGRQPS